MISLMKRLVLADLLMVGGVPWARSMTGRDVKFTLAKEVE